MNAHHPAAPVMSTFTRKVEGGEYGRALLVLDTENVRDALQILLDKVLDLRAHHYPAGPRTATTALLTAAGAELTAEYSWEGLWLTVTLTAPDDPDGRLGMTEARIRHLLSEHAWLVLADAIRAWGTFVTLADDGAEPWPLAARIAAYTECLGVPEVTARRLARRSQANASATPEQWQQRVQALYRDLLR